MAKTATTVQGVVPPSVERKIIYEADVALVVDDLDRANSEVARLTTQSGGYVAQQEVSGSPGSLRRARWKLRVPVQKFEGFLDQLARLGELERQGRTSQDVTEEFVDVGARVKNKRTEEARLVKILEERTGVLEDVLKVETELSRVRGEIEQLEGRLRLLENLTSLTTVTLNLRERRRYDPDEPASPRFATQIERTFRDSLDHLATFGKNLVLMIVAIAPWLPIIGLGLWLLAWLARRWSARRRTGASPADRTST